MPSNQKSILFRAVHTKTRWRKAKHETFANARDVGSRSARALFLGENNAIDYRKHGEPRYVVIWDERAAVGEVLKPDDHSPRDLRSKAVSPEMFDRWERAGGVSVEELESYFNTPAPDREANISTQTAGTQAPIFLPETIEQLEAMLQSEVRNSRVSSEAARRERLKAANPTPHKIQVQASAFLRNADVIVEVLQRADGWCERCREQAPFLRASDGSPYLEVHHIVPLALGGLDTVANAQALCPNCHRRFHFGRDEI